MELDYQIWDVFTNKVFSGNPLAIIPDASGLSDDIMQKIAKEFNLSETSFIVNSENGFRARYFTPAREVPMAGHPTIGTVYSLWDSGLITSNEIRLELKAGIFPIKLDIQNDSLQRVWMNQGIPKMILECHDRSAVAKALGLTEADIVADLPIQLISAGLEFLFVPVKSLDILAKASLNLSLLPDILPPEHRAVFVFTLDAPEAKVRARMFGEALGVIEDPATGSAHGPLGLYMANNNLLDFKDDQASFISHQGVEMGRASQIELKVNRLKEGYQVEIAGQAVKIAEGKLFL